MVASNPQRAGAADNAFARPGLRSWDRPADALPDSPFWHVRAEFRAAFVDDQVFAATIARQTTLTNLLLYIY